MITNILHELKKICENIENRSLYKELIVKLEKLDSPFTRVAVLGGINSGKTTLLNEMFADEFMLPVSALSSKNDIHIFPNDTDNFYVKDNEKKVFAGKDTLKLNSETSVNIHLNSKWLHEYNVSVSELNNLNIEEKEITKTIINSLLNFDYCIYILDGLAAFNKTDAFVLGQLNRFEIPCLVLVSKYNLLSNEEQQSVLDYLNEKLKKYTTLKYSGQDNLNSKKTLSSITKSFIQEISKTYDFKLQRANFKKLLTRTCIVEGIEFCQSKIDNINLIKEIKEKETQEKLNELKFIKIEWMRLETKLSDKRQKLEETIREELKVKEQRILRRLEYDIRTCNDIKQYWNVELPFRLEEMFGIETQVLIQVINSEITNNLTWLQNELNSLFEIKQSVASRITFSISNDNIAIDDLQLVDYKKLKMITTIGKMSTTFFARILFKSPVVGNVVAVSSMLADFGADIFMKKKARDAKEKVLVELPSLLRKINLAYVIKISDSVRATHDEILIHLQKTYNNWEEKRRHEITQEEEILLKEISDSEWSLYKEQFNNLLLNTQDI